MKMNNTMDMVKTFQKNEITEYHVYSALARKTRGKNAKVLEKIAGDELRHYNEWKEYSKTDVEPDRFLIHKYLMIARLFGITFAIKMMENGEKKAEENYESVAEIFPKAREIMEDEEKHEKMLIGMIDEEKINYIGSMVLGLNDALVELTGALAGLSFALQKTSLIAIVGLITGIAAAMSMGASEYLSKKSEGDKNPFKASVYTGIAYILTVIFLVAPYFIFSAYYIALVFTVANAVIVILFFSFFVSVVKEHEFKKMFINMMTISLGIALISFIIGIIVRTAIGVDI